MTSIQVAAFPVPATVAVRSKQLRRQSGGGDQFVFTAVPDAQVKPRVFACIWRNPFGAVGDAVRRFFDEHAAETFDFKVPRTGEVVRVRFFSGPAINWGSSASVASLTVELEETLAHE